MQHKIVAMQGTLAATRADLLLREAKAERHFVVDSYNVACNLPNPHEETKACTQYDEATADRRAKVAKLLEGKEAGDSKILKLALSRTTPLVSGRRREAGLDVLSELGYGREWVTNDLLERLQQSNGNDQAFALEALSAATPRGQQQTLQAVRLRLVDALPAVRRAALKAWGALALRGDPEAVAAVLPLLEDPEVIVRRSAVSALEELANRPQHWVWGDTPVISALCARLQDSDFEVRRGAVRAVALAASHGDPQVISAAASLLEHKDPKIRSTAGEALRAVSSPDDPVAAAGIARRLGKISMATGKASEAEIRATATRTLDGFASNPRAIQEITMLMAVDSDSAVRCAATRALASTAHRGDGMAVAAACAACVDTDLDVRREAGRTRQKLEVRPWVPVRIRRKQEARDAKLLPCLPASGDPEFEAK